MKTRKSIFSPSTVPADLFYIPAQKSRNYLRAFILTAIFMPLALTAENRVALVVGNSGYAGEAKLTNPESDARAMHRELTALNFKVDLVLDADRQEINKALGKFIKSLDKDTVGLFYFAGHGIQVDGANYLLPLRAEADDLYVAKNNSVALNQIFDAFHSAETRLNVVILDCCRNNPFTNQRVARAVRSVSRGLADQAAPPGTIVTFSTSAGDTAADGVGGNSPYTHALAAELARRPEDGLLLSTVLRNTAREVYKTTGQDPILNIPGSAEEVFLFGTKAQPVKNGDPDNSSALQQADLMKHLAALRLELDEYKKQKQPQVQESARVDLAEINQLLEQQKAERAALESQIATLLAQINAAAAAPTMRVVEAPSFLNYDKSQLDFFMTHHVPDSAIAHWSEAQLRYTINYLYARNGYAFERGPIRNVFDAMPWYQPSEGLSMEAIDARMNPFEVENIKRLAYLRSRKK